MIIRDATRRDEDAIRSILKGIIEHGGLTALTDETIAPFVTDNIEDYVARASFVVAQTDRVIGFQYLKRGTGIGAHVGDIATFSDINMRQTGIGRALFNATCERARQQGIRKITAMIRADNTNGLGYYPRMGFKRVGTLREHVCIDGRYIDDILMELFI